MGQYSSKGLYNKYNKNNKEREEKDYYATPTVEVVNILDTLGYDFSNKTILEPCIGGGHMADGILEYIEKSGATNVRLIGRDVQDRGYSDFNWELEYGQDFLSDDYPDEDIDIIIMNPPYSILEPFMIRALEIAKEKVIVLGRTQATEGSGRYEKIYKNNPFTHFYQYVDRIQCWKNGVKPTGSSAQAYGWLIWDKLEKNEKPTFNWIRRK